MLTVYFYQRETLASIFSLCCCSRLAAAAAAAAVCVHSAGFGEKSKMFYTDYYSRFGQVVTGRQSYPYD